MKKIFPPTLLFSIIASALPIYASTESYDILSDINTYRAGYNLLPLEKNDVLCTLAAIRVGQIRAGWSHEQFQPEIDKIPNMDGVFYENLARTLEAKDVVWGWSMSQVGHKEAMLKPEMKLGCVVQSGDHYAFEGYIPSKINDVKVDKITEK